jgi:hypothetical protein
VSYHQIVATLLLIVVLAGLALYYAWRQVQTLRELRHDDNLPPEDRSYLRNQAWRRLVSSALMVVFAALLAGSFRFEWPLQDLVNQGEEAAARNEHPELDPGQKQLVRFAGFYWVAALLVLLGLVGLALFDILAIRRFGQRHFRRIQADRRAMIERQAARLRERRNGHAEN